VMMMMIGQKFSWNKVIIILSVIYFQLDSNAKWNYICSRLKLIVFCRNEL
jgi:hypothetical protein